MTAATDPARSPARLSPAIAGGLMPAASTDDGAQPVRIASRRIGRTSGLA